MVASEFTTKECGKGDNCAHLLGASQPATSEYFHRDRTKGDGLSTVCKACRKVTKRAWYLENAEHARAYSRQWAEEHYERVLANNRQWGRANPDKRKRYNDNWKRKNRNAHLSSRRRRYALQAVKRRAEAKEWRRSHPEMVRVQWKVRQARKRANGGNHTPDDIRALLRQQKGNCWWCGQFAGQHYHVDHRVPIAKGGSNDVSNLVISCANCNLSKRDKLPQDWNGRLL